MLYALVLGNLFAVSSDSLGSCVSNNNFSKTL